MLTAYLLGALIALVLVACLVTEPLLLIVPVAIAAGYFPLTWAARWVRRACQPIRTAFRGKDEP